MSRFVCERLREKYSFPTTAFDARESMEEFRKIAELAHCVGPNDDTNIEWHRCAAEQRSEYRC